MNFMVVSSSLKLREAIATPLKHQLIRDQPVKINEKRRELDELQEGAN